MIRNLDDRASKMYNAVLGFLRTKLNKGVQFNKAVYVLAFCAGLCVFSVSTGFAGGGGSFPTPSTGGGSAKPDRSAEFGEYYRQGIQFLQQTNYMEAEKKLKKAVKIQSRHGDARTYLGIAQVGLHDYDKARKSLEKAIKYETSVPAAWEQLGVLYLNDGDLDAAKEQLAALQSMRDGCADPCPLAGQLATSYDNLAKNIASHGGGSNESTDVPSGDHSGDRQSHLLTPFDNEKNQFARKMYVEAVSAINREQYSAAIVILDRLVFEQPYNADALTYLGFSHRKQGRFDVAKAYYDQALAIDDQHAGANQYLGELYVQLDQLSLADAQLAKLDQICQFACVEYEDLKALIDERRKG